MAFDAAGLSCWGQALAGKRRFWDYESTDAISVVTATDYFADMGAAQGGGSFGMAVGDLIFYNKTNSSNIYLLKASAQDADNNITAGYATEVEDVTAADAVTGLRFIMSSGGTFQADSGTVTLVSHAGTLAKRFGVVTTEPLTTNAAASQAFVLTIAGVAAGDLAFVQYSGGTNTKGPLGWKAVTSTNTLTVTVTNGNAAALDGTLIFNYGIFDAPA